MVKNLWEDFPGDLVIKTLPANAGDTDGVLGLGRVHILQSNEAYVQQLLKPEHPRACAPQQEQPPQLEVCTLQLEIAPACCS